MSHSWTLLLWAIAVLSMTIGNLGALMQSDVKRMLAYSSIAHAGYLLVAFTALPQNGIAAACFYTAAYAAMNVGAFAVITQVSGFSERLRTIDDYRGLAGRRPVLAALFAFFLLSLIGIPFTGGFFGKFYVFSAALQSGHVLETCRGGSAEQRRGLLLLSAPTGVDLRSSGAGRRDCFWTHLHRSASLPGSALTLAAAATLILGILPNHVLQMAGDASSSLRTTNPSGYCEQHPESCPAAVGTVSSPAR